MGNDAKIHGIRLGAKGLAAWPVVKSHDGSTKANGALDVRIDVLTKKWLGILRGISLGLNYETGSQDVTSKNTAGGSPSAQVTKTSITPYAGLTFPSVYKTGAKYGGVGGKMIVPPFRLHIAQAEIGMGPEIEKATSDQSALSHDWKVGVSGHVGLNLLRFELLLDDTRRFTLNAPSVMFQCGSASEDCNVFVGGGLTFTYWRDYSYSK